MIGEKATFEQYGYHSYDLKPQSDKKVVAVCDGCGKVRISSKSHYHARCKSCARKGKHPSEETRQKISDTLEGEHLSEGTRKKMSDAHEGIYPSEETRKKLRGKNHHNWQGGKSFEPYCSKFNEEFKEYIREKFGRVCFLCPKTEEENGQRLSVHHVNYDKSCLCNDNLTCQFVPLCISCNSKVNKNREMWEKKIKDKMKNKLNGWYI